MLGSKITPDLLPQLGQLFPLMLCGLLCRLMGVLLGILLTCSSRERTQSILPDTLFCFLCTLPRATIQGALGPKPNKLHFFGASAICSFIFTAAQLYILCYSVTGMILLHTLGPKLLLWSQDQQPTQRSQQLAGTEEVETGLLKQATSDRASMASSQASGKLACFFFLRGKGRERIGCHVSIFSSLPTLAAGISIRCLRKGLDGCKLPITRSLHKKHKNMHFACMFVTTIVNC